MDRQTTKIDFYQVRDFGDVFNASFRFLSQNFKQIFLHQLTIGGPFLLVGIAIQSYLAVRASIWTQSGEVFSQIGTSYLVNLVALVIGVVMIISVMNGYMKLYKDSPDPQPIISLGEIWEQVKSDFWWLLLRIVVYYVLLAVVFGGIGVIGYMIFASGSSMGLKVAVGVVFFLGAFVLFIFLSPYIGLFITQSYFERTDVATSISRTFYLIRNHWWLSFGLGFVNVLIMGILSSIASVPVVILQWLTQIMTLQGDTTVDASTILILSAVGVLLQTLSHLIITMLHFSMAAFFYHSQLERKDGTGLLNRIETLGQSSERAKSSVNFYDEEEKY